MSHKPFKTLEDIDFLTRVDAGGADGFTSHLYGENYFGNEELKGVICLRCANVFRDKDNNVIVFDANGVDVRKYLVFSNTAGVVCMKDCQTPFSPVEGSDLSLAKVIPIITEPQYKLECPFEEFSPRD